MEIPMNDRVPFSFNEGDYVRCVINAGFKSLDPMESIRVEEASGMWDTFKDGGDTEHHTFRFIRAEEQIEYITLAQAIMSSEPFTNHDIIGAYIWKNNGFHHFDWIPDCLAVTNEPGDMFGVNKDFLTCNRFFIVKNL